MALTKFASFEVSEILDIKGAPTKQRTASLDKLGDFHDYRTGDGYLYVRIKAQSSRVNKNNDGWPSIEMAGGKEVWDKLSSQHQGGIGFTAAADSKHRFGYSTFVGKPIFVDHHNSEPKRTRGAIVDSKLHVLDHKTAAADDYWSSEDADPEHLPPTEIELLLEVDAQEFPKFAKGIIDGDLDGFSMGCDVEYSKCSHCGHEASNPHEYCSHIKMKGAELRVESGKHAGSHRKSYENCYGVGYFEISGVFDPADDTALTQEIIHEGAVKTAAPKTEPPEPQVDLTKAPDEVNTLRQERVCPQCGADVDDTECPVCHYEFPPESLQNPNLEEASEVREQRDAQPGQDLTIPADGDTPPPADGEGQSYLQARKPQPTASLTNDMRWTPHLNSRLAAPKPQGDEPNEVVTSDQSKPVTSAFRTAQEMIASAAAKRNQENKMTDTPRVAAEPADPSGKPDKRVQTTGVGGVDEATNEQASKPEGPHSWENKGTTVDVTGKGGIIEDSNAEASTPSDGTESLPTAGQDSNDSGFNKDKNITGTPTKTFDNSNEPGSAVTDKAFPTSAAHQAYDDKPFPHNEPSSPSAKGGAQPADPVGKPDERVDLTAPTTTTKNNSGPTTQWTGTGGNGVTRQQDPVTNVPTKSNGINAHVVAAFRLADEEVDLGLLDGKEKFNRVEELLELSPEELAAEARVTSRVRTAGLSREASASKGPARLPSFARHATTEPEPVPVVDQDNLDSGLFL